MCITVHESVFADRLFVNSHKSHILSANKDHQKCPHCNTANVQPKQLTQCNVIQVLKSTSEIILQKVTLNSLN